MSLTSPIFVAFSAVAIALLRILPSGKPREWAIFLLNAVFLGSLVSSPYQLVPLVCFVLLGYVAISVAAARPSMGLAILILGLVAIFAWLKRYPIAADIPTFGFLYTVVGLSYMLFRILHVLIDVSQGSLGKPRFLGYLNYIFFFLSLLSGPIQRYEEFERQAAIKPPPPPWREVKIAASRVVLGYLMVVVFAAVATNFHGLIRPAFEQALATGEIGAGTKNYALLSSAYLINLFVNFAGYMHIVIGVGGLAGIVLPENFNHPFVAKNFLDLWARWHMTLSNWLKFYLFNALLQALSERFGTRERMPYLGAIALFVTFVVIGVWHGPTPIFFAYGLFLGIGAVVNSLWQIWLPKWIGKAAYKELVGKRWYYELSRAATLSYLAVSLCAFWIDPETAAGLARPRGLAMFALAFLVMTVVGAAAGWLWDLAHDRAQSILHGRPLLPGSAAPSSALGRLAIVAVPLVAIAIASMIGSGVVLGITGALSSSSPPRAASVIVLVAAVLTVAASAGGLLEPAFDRFFQSAFTERRQADAAAVWLGVRALIVINFAVLLASSIPDFIYKAF